VSHASDKKGLLSMPLLEMCEACHDEQFDEINGKGIRSRHAMAIKGKACLSCHTSHSSSHAKLLTVASRATCLSCHTDPVKAGKHTLPGMKAQLAKKHVHGPTEDEDCTECHSPHGSKQVTLLKHAYPASFYSAFASDAYALCFECHDAELVTVADTDEHTEFRNAKRNLHHLHVNKKTKGRSCRTCHAAHASDQPSQIRNSVPFGSSGWSIPIRFQKTEDGGSCQSGCHEPRRYDREKTIDTAIPVVRPKSPKPEPEPKPGPAERAKPPEK
ncbi:hypothetical protein HQ560_10770, partial [bacterium]|nr:hypothetical protein [bacterium]